MIQIAEEKIEKAVAYANSWRVGSAKYATAWLSLNFLGILACKECNTEEQRHEWQILRQECSSCSCRGKRWYLDD